MSAYDTSLQTGDVFSLVFIILTLALLIVAARKTRTLRSFQTEMLAFAVVLFAAEIPEILSTLGLLDLTYIMTLGESVHAISMTILVIFVARRLFGFYKSR